MKEESEEWLVRWDDGTEKKAPFVGLAWYAREFKDDATVELL